MGIREWKILTVGIAGTFLAAVLLVIIAMMGAHIAVEPQAGVVEAGDMAPALRGSTMDEQSLSPSDYEGKVVLVNFWATWCPPCLEEMPKLIAMQEQYGPQGFQIIAISTDRSREEVEAYLNRIDENFPVVHDEGRENLVRYGVRSYPTTFLIDRNGRIVLRTHTLDFEAQLKELL